MNDNAKAFVCFTILFPSLNSCKLQNSLFTFVLDKVIINNIISV